jgi:hypothetical protein
MLVPRKAGVCPIVDTFVTLAFRAAVCKAVPVC